MNAQQKAELNDLCGKIAAENDHHKFLALVLQLDQLLQRLDLRSQSLPDPTPQSSDEPA